MEVCVPQQGVAVACPVLASPLPALAGASELIDNELLDALPPMESDSMVCEQDFEINHDPKRQKPCTPPFNAPSSPEQASSSKSSSGGLAAYSADDLQQKRAARLARNRQSAQELRNRKRQYAERVGQENESLRLQSSQLQARVSSLTAENNLLREENNFYRGMLAGRSATQATLSKQTPVTSQRSAQASATGNARRSTRGVGVLASLLAMIGMTVNQERVPSTMDSSGLFVRDPLPLSSRRVLHEADEASHDERLALPDKSLLTRRQDSSATAVASDVGLVIRNAATPLIPGTATAEPSSVAALQLGTRRFILAAADSAIRWVSTPVVGTDSRVDSQPLEQDSSNTIAPVPVAVEQDDYILGGPTLRIAAPLTKQHSPASVAESVAPKDTAVALSWTEEDTTEFLVRMLATMDVSEKEQVINMLVREYGADVFGGLFEHAMTASPDTEGQQISMHKSSGSLGTSAATSTIEESAVEGLPCDCVQETAASVVVVDVAHSAAHMSG